MAARNVTAAPMNLRANAAPAAARRTVSGAAGAGRPVASAAVTALAGAGGQWPALPVVVDKTAYPTVGT